MGVESIEYKDGCLKILDQLVLPEKTEWLIINTVEDGWRAIHTMQTRGAPAIAIVGCLSLAVELRRGLDAPTREEFKERVFSKLEYLVSARPTAVNMRNEAAKLMKLCQALVQDSSLSVSDMKNKVVNALEGLLEKDLSDNRAIGEHGARALLEDTHGSSLPLAVLTHCNTGSLATAGHGTALGIIRCLAAQEHLGKVYFTETRPYLQGARLTGYELLHEKIPSTLICDNMVAALMQNRSISAVVVGADRVAANGDTANKIGTYQIAVVAKWHKVPFYVAAPFSSIDKDLSSGASIPIEERPSSELTTFMGHSITAPGVQCWNPAFDVTPADLITKIITERGAFSPSSLRVFL